MELSFDVDEERRRAAAQRSYTTSAISTSVRYFVHRLPGLIANIVYWPDARRKTVICKACRILFAAALVLATLGWTALRVPWTAHATTDLSQRYVVFLDGINSCSMTNCNFLQPDVPNLDTDFGDIKSQLGTVGMSRFVYFSYSSAQYYPQSFEYCLGWGSDGSDCSPSGDLVSVFHSPVYTSGNTHLSIKNQTAVLDWLLHQIHQRDPSAVIDLVGYSLGGIVASYWASEYGGTSDLRSQIHGLVLIESPVGGFALAGPIEEGCGLLDLACLSWQGALTATFGDTLLQQLSLDGSNSIVSLLPPAGRNVRVTSIQSTDDYLVNGLSIRVCDNIACTSQDDVPVGTGSQGWNSTIPQTLHNDHSLGGDGPITTPQLPLLDKDHILHNHLSPLHNSVTWQWVNEAVQITSAIIPLPKSDDTDACEDRSLLANDDGSTGAIPLPFTANFFGNSYGAVFINNNGNVTFNGSQSTYTPYPLLTTRIPIIAPFFADVDTRGTGSSPVTYSYGDGLYAGHPTLCVDWVNVGYYSGHTDKLNSVQLLLVDRSDTGPGNFDIMFNYNQIQWEAGDASGGHGGLGGSCARVGYSNGTSTSFELPGSAVCGSFLDSNPSGLIHGSLNSTQPGRYSFPVRNGVAPTGGTISGHVFANSNDPANALSGAFVQVCSATNCNNTLTGATGNYTVSGLADGSYTATAFPPGGTSLFQNSVSNLVITGANTLTDQDIVLHGPVPLPNSTTITNRYVNPNGIPVIYWQDQLTLTTLGCTGGTASYQITLADGTVARSGGMAEGPSGTYTATIAPLYPNHGDAHVAITITCPSGPPTNTGFDIYIDPSGTVQTVGGAPVVAASVTLYRSDSSSGPFAPVPNGSGIMSVANRNNPDTTDANGHFGWDVIAGFYKVRAAKAGCVSPSDPTQPYVDSTVLSVPPAVTNLVLTLNCNTDSTPPTTTASASSQPNTAGWSNSDVAVALRATDNPGGSGVAQSYYAVDNAACTSSNVSSCSIYTGSPFPVSGDGIHTITFFSKDNAGNVEAAKTVTVKIDKTPPTITFARRTPANSFGWNNADVTVTWDCADSLSGPVTPTVSQTLTQEGANQSVTGTCADAAGNTASDTQTSINIDKTAPSVSPSPSRNPDSSGWYNYAFAVGWLGTDSLSGIATCSAAASYGGPDTASGSLTGTCTDKAGNTASASYGFRFDATPPTVACSVTPATMWPPNHKMVPVATTVTVADALSGPAGFTLVSATTNEGSAATDIQGFTPGSSSTNGYVRAERLGPGIGRIYTLTYQGRDVAGNTKTCSATVTVPHDQGH